MLNAATIKCQDIGQESRHVRPPQTPNIEMLGFDLYYQRFIDNKSRQNLQGTEEVAGCLDF